MNESYYNKILKMVYDINNISNKNEKIEAIYKLSSYCAFLYYCGHLSRKEYLHAMMKIVDDLEEKEYEKGRDKCIKELINNNGRLTKYYKEYLNIYNMNFIPKSVDYEFNISIYRLFQEFIKYMHCDKVYYHLLAKKNISFSSIIDHSMCVNNRDDSFIIVNEENKFNRYFIMSHEIAHAYENYVMRDYKSYFDIGYNAEIFSILFNRIFKEFVLNSNVLNENDEIKLINKFEVNYYNFMLQTLFITEIMESNNYTILDYELYMNYKKITLNCSLTDHNYAIGNIISLQLLNRWRESDLTFIEKLPELIKEIRNMKLNELINVFNNKNIVTDEIKRLIKN